MRVRRRARLYATVVLVALFATGAATLTVVPGAAAATAGSLAVDVLLDAPDPWHLPVGEPTRVTGEVLNTGTVEGATGVEVVLRYAGTTQDVVTGDDGGFAFIITPTDDGLLTVDLPDAADPEGAGHDAVTVQPFLRTVTITGSVSATQTFVDEPVTVHGTVLVQPDNTPAAGVTVHLSHPAGTATAVTGTDGSWSALLTPTRFAGGGVAASIDDPRFFVATMGLDELFVRAARLTLTATLGTGVLRPGQTTSVVGRLSRAVRGDGVMGAPVTVDWVSGSAVVTTDAAGGWAVPLPIGAGRVTASTPSPDVGPPLRRFLAAPVVRPWTTSFSGASATVTKTSTFGRRVRVTGRVLTDQPGHPGRDGAAMSLVLLTDGGRRSTTIATGRSGADGSYLLTGSAALTGDTRVVAAADAEHATASTTGPRVLVSSVVTVHASATRIVGARSVLFRFTVRPHAVTTALVWDNHHVRPIARVRLHHGRGQLRVRPPRGRTVYEVVSGPRDGYLAGGHRVVVRRR